MPRSQTMLSKQIPVITIRKGSNIIKKSPTGTLTVMVKPSVEPVQRLNTHTHTHTRCPNYDQFEAHQAYVDAQPQCDAFLRSHQQKWEYSEGPTINTKCFKWPYSVDFNYRRDM
jgi:hypothetical protein